MLDFDISTEIYWVSNPLLWKNTYRAWLTVGRKTFLAFGFLFLIPSDTLHIDLAGK